MEIYYNHVAKPDTDSIQIVWIIVNVYIIYSLKHTYL